MNGLKSPIKRHRLTKCSKNQNPSIYSLQNHTLALKKGITLQQKDRQKDSGQLGPGSKQSVILISDKVDFKLKQIRRDKGPCFILIKGIVNQGDSIILHIHAPNAGAHNCIFKIVLLDLKTNIFKS